ncbi:MAG: hypothetical protein PHY48_15370 [Candidatus Cloacimonetes bacterium]|nr:hypothetical protein [Candidatus Cloacimonadota bacterium]
MIPVLAYVAASIIGTGAGLIYVNASRIIRGASNVVAGSIINGVDKALTSIPVVTHEPTKEVSENTILKPVDHEPVVPEVVIEPKVIEPEPVVETTFKK